MILDEPTAHMDAPGIDLFLNKFLPQLLKIVPHVIVISPNHLDVDMEKEVWTVVKEGGVSTLRKGVIG
jgi:ABC-type molybdenum transport system ATPase subunit/photorepair protein PhrA